MRMNKWIRLLAWVCLFQFVGYAMGMVTQDNMHPWYDMLNKSSLTPPGVVFGIVWTLMYFLLAVMGSVLSSPDSGNQTKPALTWFIIQTVINFAWTPLFFYYHWIGFACLWLVLLLCVNVKLFLMLNARLKWLRYILSPYLLWLTFATYLNVAIWLTN